MFDEASPVQVQPLRAVEASMPIGLTTAVGGDVHTSSSIAAAARCFLAGKNTAVAKKKKPKVLQKRWKCDVCRVKWFLNFHEAVRHENNCDGNLSPPPATATTATMTTIARRSAEEEPPKSAISTESIVESYFVSVSEDSAEVSNGPSSSEKSLERRERHSVNGKRNSNLKGVPSERSVLDFGRPGPESADDVADDSKCVEASDKRSARHCCEFSTVREGGSTADGRCVTAEAPPSASPEKRRYNGWFDHPNLSGATRRRKLTVRVVSDESMVAAVVKVLPSDDEGDGGGKSDARQTPPGDGDIDSGGDSTAAVKSNPLEKCPGLRRSKRRRNGAVASAPTLKPGSSSVGDTILAVVKGIASVSGKEKVNIKAVINEPPKPRPTKKKKKETAAHLASIFVHKKGDGNKKGKAPPDDDTDAGEEPHVPKLSKRELVEHVAVERFAALRKRDATASASAGMRRGVARLSATSRKHCRRGKDEDEESLEEEESDESVGYRSRRAVIDDDHSDDNEEGYVEAVERKANISSSSISLQSSSSAGGAEANKKGGAPLSKGMIAEHRAVELFAQRKRKAAEERERQKKRDEIRKARMEQKNREAAAQVEGEAAAMPVETVVKDAILSSVGTKMLPAAVELVLSSSAGCRTPGLVKQSVPQFPAAVRFPHPSHVGLLDSNDAASEDKSFTESGMSSGLKYLRETPKYPCCRLSHADFTESIKPQLGFHDGERKVPEPEAESILDAFSSVFIPSSVSIDDEGTESGVKNSRLWADKYVMKCVPEDVLGDENKSSSLKLITFINEWKVRRQSALRMKVERDRIKKCGNTRHKGRKKPSCGYNSDDSFLDDEECGLENVFLITGPSSSGKSCLVHVAAKQCACVLLEINTTERRGGQAFKHAIEESTQSHSSLALLKLGCGNTIRNFSTVPEDEESCCDSGESGDESEDDKEHPGNAPSLAIILIDEVDLLFEEDGDSGFWIALSQLSKKAKCPIVLTSTFVPPQLSYGCNFRFRSITLQKPSFEDCAAKLREISEAEGLSMKDNLDNREKTARLYSIAELCQCDMRRIVNEMQVFRHSNARPFAFKKILPGNGMSESMDDIQFLELDRPLILGIKPATVSSNSNTVIIIRGENFLRNSYADGKVDFPPLELYIGSQRCQFFRALNENLIVAICPPCIPPKGVNESGINEDLFEESLSCSFAPVLLKKRCSNGVILDSSTGSLAQSESINAGVHRSLWNIEYSFPQTKGKLGLFYEEKSMKKNPGLQRRNQEDNASSDGFLSSSDDDFQTAKPCMRKTKWTQSRAIRDKEYEKQGVNKEDAATLVASEGNDNDVYAEKDTDPNTLLDQAIENMGDAGDKAPNIEVSSPEQPGSTSRARGVLEMNSFAEEFQRLSDAALLEDSLTRLAVPLLSGAVRGFGSESVEFDLSGELSSLSSNKKLSRGQNLKPPSFESIYSSSLNDSGFFFGNSDHYVTHPTRQRDRHLLSWSDKHSRGLGFLDCTSSAENCDTESKSSSTEDETTMKPFSRNRAAGEDDIFLSQEASSSLLFSPLLLTKDIVISEKHAFTRSESWLLEHRKTETASIALGLMRRVLQIDDEWHSPFFGFRHDGGRVAVNRAHALLDDRLSLDYLPHLRLIAYYEQVAADNFEGAMSQNREQTSTRRLTRSSNRGRPHYFERISYRNHDDEDLKRAGAQLAMLHLGYSTRITRS